MGENRRIFLKNQSTIVGTMNFLHNAFWMNVFFVRHPYKVISQIIPIRVVCYLKDKVLLITFFPHNIPQIEYVHSTSRSLLYRTWFYKQSMVHARIWFFEFRHHNQILVVPKCLWYSFILQITHCRVEASATVRHEDEYFSRCFHQPSLTWDGGIITVLLVLRHRFKPVDSRCIHFRKLKKASYFDGNPKLRMHQDLRGSDVVKQNAALIHAIEATEI